MLDTRVDESAFEAELPPQADVWAPDKGGFSLWAELRLILRRPPITACDIAAPGPKRISSGSLDYFDDSRATPPSFPSPPTVRVGSEDIMSHCQ
jgi:hypothetical protein